MRQSIRLLLFFLCVTAIGAAAPKDKIRFGTWMPVKLFVGPSEQKSQQIQVRAMYVGARLREFTTGEPHPVTDTTFVVRKAYRLNDSLPDDPKKIPVWRWQRGGWLLVDRSSGRVSNLELPEFDPYYSTASWYRDFIAYCGVSDDGERLFAVITQIGRKKPLLMRGLGVAHNREEPDSQCAPPKWQRDPVRVTFEPVGVAPFTVQVVGRHVNGTETAQDDHH
jgi:hypothetical protein